MIQEGDYNVIRQFDMANNSAAARKALLDASGEEVSLNSYQLNIIFCLNKSYFISFIYPFVINDNP